MTDTSPNEYHKLLDQKRFLGEVEQGIRLANREIIHSLIPALTRETFVSFAVAVGQLRAKYLEAAFKIATTEDGQHHLPSKPDIDALRLRREMFEEARIAFDALRDAIEKGYVDVEGLESSATKE